MHSILSTSFTAQPVPSLKCHRCSVPTSISQGHPHTQLPANKPVSKAPALQATCPHKGVPTSKPAVLKVWSCPQSQNYFMITLGQYVPFSRSFYHGCTVEFSRGFVTCGDITDLTVMDCVLVYLALKISCFQFLRH